ncbi:cytochrome c-type biogenesis protein [Ferrovibrio terrae]|uniref:cytochrome c-type biogenesis protein n=1 Tax=Ferrovibrio terrae TaxID=2594003 RepID=UPI003137E8E3
MLRPLLILLLLAMPVAAQQLEDRLADPAQELRARELSRELRCLVCQNQSIEDSNAPLARDLRRIVRERVALGESDQTVLNYLVDRYGEWVLLKPRFNAQTLLLWLGPPLLLLIGGGVLFALYRRQRSAMVPAAVALNADEQRRLADLLDDREPRP